MKKSKLLLVLLACVLMAMLTGCTAVITDDFGESYEIPLDDAEDMARAYIEEQIKSYVAEELKNGNDLTTILGIDQEEIEAIVREEIQSAIEEEISNGDVLNIIQAVVFFYYCRFGEAYLADALVFTCYRLAILRNNRLHLTGWYNARRVTHTVEAIDESPTPEFYFHYCRMPSNRYAIQYDLKTTTYNDELMKSQRHGPNFWRYLLCFASSNGYDYGIGRTICFKKEVQELLQYVAKAFKQELDEDLFLK